MSTKPRRSARSSKLPTRYEPPIAPMEDCKGNEKHGSRKERKNSKENEPDDYLPYNPERDDPPPLGCVDMESAGIEPGPDKDGYFFVEDIEGRRWHKNGWQFYCSWKGYSRVHNTWEPYSELNGFCKALVHERFTRRGQGMKSLTPTEEQQRAVDEALRQSRILTANTNEKNKYKEYADSDTDSKRPYSGFVDADYCPSDTDQDSLDDYVADNNSITSQMDHTFYKDEKFMKATAAAVVTPTQVKLVSPHQNSISFPTPCAKKSISSQGKQVKPHQKRISFPIPCAKKSMSSQGKQVKRHLTTKKVVVPKRNLALNKHFAEILHSYARYLQKTDKPIDNKQDRLFQLVTELGCVIHKEDESAEASNGDERDDETMDSNDYVRQQQPVTQQSGSKSVDTASYDCGKVTLQSGSKSVDTTSYDCGNVTQQSGSKSIDTTSYDCGNVTQQSGSKSVGTRSYDCGKITCGEGDLQSSDEYDNNCDDSDDGYATQDETICK